jgi:Tfp pilus assembly protein PilN
LAVPIHRIVRAVNLLPTDLRGASSRATAERGAGPEGSGGAGAFVVLGVLAACVAGAAGYVLTENTIKQRTADLSEVTARQQALQQQATQLKPYADYDQMAKARVQTVRDLAGSRFDWEQALRDLSRAVPADVTLTELDGDISNGAGGGGSSLRNALPAPAITLKGCAPGQTQVARLMARLRDIDGVTRVSLGSSAAEKVQGQSSAPTEREQRNSQPCGLGARPKFEIVMFFEKATAAVGTTPTTSTGTVGESPTPAATPAASATPAAGGTGSTSTSSTTTTQPQGGATP